MFTFVLSVFENGNIVLTANGESVAYWVEQGVNSPFISKENPLMTDVLDKGNSEL